MSRKTVTLREASINPKVIRYHLWGIALLMTLTLFGIPLLPLVLPLAWVLLKRYYERLHIELTRRDLKVTRGILNHEEKTIPLEKITDLAIYQGPIMRLFDLKGIRVETAGQTSGGALVTVVGIEQVEDFRDAVLEQRDRISDRDEEDAADLGSGVTSASVGDPASIELLAAIRDSLARIEQSLKRND